MRENSRSVVLVEGVEKAYGDERVLRGLDLAVQGGEVYGFLGRNGAGKSTTIKIVMGIATQDAGRVALFGSRSRKQLTQARQRVGYVAQEQHFYPWMTPIDLAKFVGPLYPAWDATKFAALLKRFELTRTRRIGGFSGGMKARLALSVALSCGPELLVLDEPTAGMDPVGRREFLDLVNQHAFADGVAVLFSTHVLDDVAALASRVGVLERGRMLFEGSKDDLVRSVASYSVATARVTSHVEHAVPEFSSAVRFSVLRRDVHQDRLHVIVRFAPLPAHAITPTGGWRRERMTLEDVFVALVSTSQ